VWPRTEHLSRGDAPNHPHPLVEFVKINVTGQHQQARGDEFLTSPHGTREPGPGDDSGALYANIVTVLSHLPEVIKSAVAARGVLRLGALHRGGRRRGAWSLVDMSQVCSYRQSPGLVLGERIVGFPQPTVPVVGAWLNAKILNYQPDEFLD
jgi:hypothetical protein